MPPNAWMFVACGINCALFTASMTGKPASMFSASHCWLLFNCASPRRASVTRSAVAASVTSRKRSAGCSNHKIEVSPSLTTCFSASGSSLKRLLSAARAWKPATPSKTCSSSGAMVTLENTAYFFSSVSWASRRLRRSIKANPSWRRNRRRLLHIFPFGSQCAASRCWCSVSCATSAVTCPCRYFSASAPVSVASAQSSRVISVSGRRAEAAGWRGVNGVNAIVIS